MEDNGTKLLSSSPPPSPTGSALRHANGHTGLPKVNCCNAQTRAQVIVRPAIESFDFPRTSALQTRLVLEKDGTLARTPSTIPTTSPIANRSVQLKLGFEAPPNSDKLAQWEAVYRELSEQSRPSNVSAPATEGVGTVRLNQAIPDLLKDEGGLSRSDFEGEAELNEDGVNFVDILKTEPPKDTLTPSRSNSKNSEHLDLPWPHRRRPTVTSCRYQYSTRYANIDSTGLIPKDETSEAPFEQVDLPRREEGQEGDEAVEDEGVPVPGQQRHRRYVVPKIQSADDLPRLTNMTRTGWDMDPFVVISFGKKVFRTRVIRHSRNPVWDEKLLFHVRRYETAFKIQLSILDWDKLSANDHIGDASFDVSELVANAPQADPETGLYPANEESDHPMKEFKLSLETSEGESWKAKHNPTISLRAKYQPYDALRQRFWRQYLKQYDTDDTMTLSHLELTSMLDSLGSTLTSSTIASFFTRFSKDPQNGELTFEEAIHCLETELGRPRSEKKRIDQDGDGMSVGATPVLMASDGQGNPVRLEELDFSGPGRVDRHPEESTDKIPAPENAGTKPMGEPVAEVAAGQTAGSKVRNRHRSLGLLLNLIVCRLLVPCAGQTADSSDASEDADADDFEGVEGAVDANVPNDVVIPYPTQLGDSYDDPASAVEIPAFIVDPLDSFKTFNQFFYRNLKPSGRPFELLTPIPIAPRLRPADFNLMSASSW
ncbi:hypothetical protein D9611_011821 [Ephemerocybe angulata]|uniref:C2 domain-containing protein n=1 Tax=Ephemerocybe angulata TaxID=980116 RepID=A0A8H5BXJ7_9AGAR|nr:hypothetical protein D9611_011821 [Tulosesus angulatus]